MVQYLQVCQVYLHQLIYPTSHLHKRRKFFTLTISLNFIGLVLAATNVWTYPRHYTGAFVLGNLLVAILMRNELFGRLLYLIVNTLFAKVSGIAGLLPSNLPTAFTLTVDSALVPLGLYVCIAALRGHPFWLRYFGIRLVNFQSHVDLHRPQGKPRCCTSHGCYHQYLGGYQHCECVSLGAEHSSQVSVANTILYTSPDYVLENSVFERHHRFIGWYVIFKKMIE